MYKLIKNLQGEISSIFRLEDNAVIPFDLANTDYQQYLAWLAESNQPLPPDAPAEGAN